MMRARLYRRAQGQMGYFFKHAFAWAVLVSSSAIPVCAQQLPPGAEFAGGAAVAAGIVLLGEKNSVTSTTGTHSPVGGISGQAAGTAGTASGLSGPSGPFGHPGTAGNPMGETSNGPLPPGEAAGFEAVFIHGQVLPNVCDIVCVIIGTATSTMSSSSTSSTSP